MTARATTATCLAKFPRGWESGRPGNRAIHCSLIPYWAEQLGKDSCSHVGIQTRRELSANLPATGYDSGNAVTSEGEIFRRSFTNSTECTKL